MAEQSKRDLYKELADEYAAPKTPEVVDISPAAYLAVTGRGEPGDELFNRQVGALYTVAFTLKMHSKFAGRDYAVCKLEGLWWGDGPDGEKPGEPGAVWNWKIMIRV